VLLTDLFFDVAVWLLPTEVVVVVVPLSPRDWPREGTAVALVCVVTWWCESTFWPY